MPLESCLFKSKINQIASATIEREQCVDNHRDHYSNSFITQNINTVLHTHPSLQEPLKSHLYQNAPGNKQHLPSFHLDEA